MPASVEDHAAIRVSCVCLGNICRSPMAAAILRHRAAAAGLPIDISSAGTSDWHTGRPAHPNTRAELAARGIDHDHAARTFRAADFAALELVLAMDARNMDDLRSLAPGAQARAKVHLIRDFDPAGPHGREVPDPYYASQDDYRRVFEMLDAACLGLVARVRSEGPPPWAQA